MTILRFSLVVWLCLWYNKEKLSAGGERMTKKRIGGIIITLPIWIVVAILVSPFIAVYYIGGVICALCDCALTGQWDLDL